MIAELRDQFNRQFDPNRYKMLERLLEQRCGWAGEYRIAETPVFVPRTMLEEMADCGAALALSLIQNPLYIESARRAIPVGFCVAGESNHPNFLTADFALIRNLRGELEPRLVEIQAFPSVFGFQAELCSAYRDAFGLDDGLETYLNGLNEQRYWILLAKTVLGKHDPENVVLAELDPWQQKTRPDFEVTARRLGIAVVDIRTLEPRGNKLHYRDAAGRLVPIHRIYNRAIADELMARNIRLPFDLAQHWDVEWAGHPNWYFLISKFSIPWLALPPASNPAVPPAVFLNDFLEGDGRSKLARAGVELPVETGASTIYNNLLLKPLFSFAGKGIQFDPAQGQLEAIPRASRAEFLLQQRMSFEPTIATPHGLTQPEIRVLYLWPDDGDLASVLSLVRLGRGKMMGVDHNRDRKWVGASAAFFPAS